MVMMVVVMRYHPDTDLCPGMVVMVVVVMMPNTNYDLRHLCCCCRPRGEPRVIGL
jgi:hypothetical protein